MDKIENETIIIFGGTGSLGNELVSRYLSTNTIYLYSRDESKHWKMALDLNHPKNLNFVIGDIRDKDKVCQTIIRINPSIIIIAAAMKHIDKCEFETNESIGTNLMGTKNILFLKRSLFRLYTVGVTAKSMENKNFWGGGILDSVIYQSYSNRKNHQVIISFNKHMICQYLGGLYATLEHGLYQKMTPYAKKLYSFLMSHDEPNRKMGLDKFKITLGIKESLDLKEFRRQMKDAINELITAKILLPESYIDAKGMVFTFISPEAWKERTDTPKY